MVKVLGNRIWIKRGESFIINFGNDECAPIILSNTLNNAYIIVRLMSTRYPQRGHYESLRWFDCKKVIRFKETRIMPVTSLSVLPEDDTGPDKNGVYKRVYSYTNNGETTYHYIVSKDESSKNIVLKDYSFKFKVKYSHNESCKLIDNEYICEIYLVSGQTVAERLKELCDEYKLVIPDGFTKVIDYYNALFNINVPDIERMPLEGALVSQTYNKPLGKFNLYVEV